MAQDHELRVHRDWIGLLQPVGLVVSPPALVAAQAFPDKNISKEQQALLALLTADDGERKKPVDFATLAMAVVGWKANKLVAGADLPEALSLTLPEFGETLRPTYAVPEPDGGWQLLVDELPDGASFDAPHPEEGKRWHASPQVRLERLLRESGVGIGVLFNRRSLRLVYAPRGESSGHVTWPLHRLVTAMDRVMLSALVMLLGAQRLFTLPREQRLPYLLKESRKYQNVVSTKLAGQVLEALNELLRGFQAADEATRGVLLGEAVHEDPDHVYGGLLAVLLRLVFILYVEERGLLSSSPVYVRNYSLTGLFEKLRSDAGRFPDTMDLRYGAWSRLCVLFRMVHDGARRGELHLPPRYGHLFDPDTWSFLEGRPYCSARQKDGRVPVPKVADGVLYRVLEKLLLLDGERLSYRALDVEQIGSVYENMMGFRLERATETSIGVGKQHVVVGLDTLLGTKGSERGKLLKEQADVELSGKAAEALKSASTVDDLVAALARRISPLTPRPVPIGGIFLQPTDERRRSGSHYTPRELTEPIVRTTLRPILEDLGPSPKPEQILALKVCDPAMGSGAFLVETCRQLAEALVKSYDVHGRPPDVPPDEDILLYAQRQVAQHCLYGVDKNPFAVDLGKLSLWLATLARDHAFTFLDHSIRHGDSLVGLTREQIASFHWTPEKQVPVIRAFIDKAIDEAMALRAQIPELANSDDVGEKRRLLRDADDALAKVRLLGDAVVACFFSEEKAKERERSRVRWEMKTEAWLSERESAAEILGFVDDLRGGEKPVPCFHWEIEFPEVFSRGGFDGVVSNPPFLGGKNISGGLGRDYLLWLQVAHPDAKGQVDLVAYFFRTAFRNLRSTGRMGLLATNTIAQGDTRTAALEWILRSGGRIIAATRRVKWPGVAAVTVSVVHIERTRTLSPCSLDDRIVQVITPFLFDKGPSEAPKALRANASKAFAGPTIDGPGFIFDDEDAEANSIADMQRVLSTTSNNRERIFPLMGGDDLLASPSLSPRRWIIDFGEMEEHEARRWPELLRIVEARVKPKRLEGALRDYPWWLYKRPAPALRRAVRGLDRMLMHPFTSTFLAFGFVDARTIVATPHIVIASRTFASFAALQSRPHEYWARFFGSSLEDRPRYTPSDCFETFPLPDGWDSPQNNLENAGRAYYEYRSEIMRTRNEGLTKVYSRFHAPDEGDENILKLRELHAAMDRAVLDAYRWTDLQPTCEFILDYEDDDDDEAAGGRRKKKPWRYRWPDELRDEVLARLLDLNAKRAKEQTTKPPTSPDEPTSPKKKRGPKKKAAITAEQGALFGKESDE
jgi:hypothetical protein